MVLYKIKRFYYLTLIQLYSLVLNKKEKDKVKKSLDKTMTFHILKLGKFNRGQTLSERRVRGALVGSIKAHGNITEDNVSSAVKRIYGGILNND